MEEPMENNSEINSLAHRFGIRDGDGVQTRSWGHSHCGGSFRCVLCGERADQHDFVSTTLFDGQDQLGDLCRTCIAAGPAAAAVRATRRAEELREQAAWHIELAQDLRTLDPARWSTLAELDAEHEQRMKEMEADAL